MSVYRLSRFIHSEIDLFNYPVILMRIRKQYDFSKNNTAYMFKAGDNVRNLAYKFYGTPDVWWAILDANPRFQSEIDIQVGDILKIPSQQEVANYV